MTTLSTVEHDYQHVVSRLQITNQSWWLYTFFAGSALSLAIGVGYLVGCLVTDGLIVPVPEAVRYGLLIGWPVVVLAALGVLVVRPLMRRRTLAATARRVETAFPDVGNDLINALQLAEDPVAAGNPFVPLAVEQAAEQADRVPISRSNRIDGWRRRLAACVCGPRDFGIHSAVLAAMLLLLSAYVLLLPQQCNWAMSRFFDPGEFAPLQGRVRIETVDPGDAQVTIDSDLRVVATIANPDHRAHQARLYRITDEGEQMFPMQPRADHGQYRHEFKTIKVPFRYRLEIGDTQSQVYEVSVHARPAVGAIRATYRFPEYIAQGAEPLTVEQRNGDLEAPEYTQVNLQFEATTSLNEAYLVTGDGKRLNCRIQPDGKTFTQDMPILADGAYAVHLVHQLGEQQFTNANRRRNAITCIKDQAPMVEIVKPGRDMTVAPGSVLELVIAAGDDYAVSALELVAIRGEENAEVRTPVENWKQFADPAKVTQVYSWKLDAKQFKPGDIVRYQVVAHDNRVIKGTVNLGPQETRSARFQVRFSDPEQARRDELDSLERIRKELMKILRRQIKAHQSTIPLKTQEQLPPIRKTAAAVQGEQVAIQKATAACATQVPDTEEHYRQLKQVLENLSTTPMVQAITWADKLAAAEKLGKVEFRLEKLLTVQQQIIVILEKVLDIIRHKQNEVLKKLEKRPGGDLPQDVVQKLEELHEKLKEMIEEQRKVIEATKNLAKKPVDDFTEEDEQKLKDLAAIEDKWERFLAEKHSDLSKLPKQDFSNPNMLDELVEIQTEIKMAKDALTKKTAEIAVPLEQLGAEMAEELTTNIEKWLPDTPDREKWSQEEPLNSDMTEAPMAELPKELEDLVGELMEEEEDLFAEAEDASSSWADSLDKGAGWDTADGPISNMSARGATGNRLPNTSEIGGRAGEGRSGKSGGEFVGNEAVGKGGRKTPSRLTPDAFEKGVVKDRSRDPVGGATGGGKESGQGGEGLEGPVPPQLAREMRRLAGKQADLRRRGEQIDVKLRVRNYNTTQWQKVLEAMSRTKEQLSRNQYQNTLRQRHVLLQGMDATQQHVRGDYRVQTDRTSSLPREAREEILNSMESESPAGWKELNEMYFKMLSEIQAQPEPAAGTQPNEPEPTP